MPCLACLWSMRLHSIGFHSWVACDTHCLARGSVLQDTWPRAARGKEAKEVSLERIAKSGPPLSFPMREASL